MKINTLRHGFTLIELLVVISVIGILSVLSIIGMQSVTDTGRKTKCTNNMRQIGMAFQSYLQDNDNTMPQRFYPSLSGLIGYDEMLLAYCGNNQKIFLCPSSNNRSFPNEPSYGMNWYYDNTNLLSVALPAQTIMVAETNDGSGGSHRADRDSEGPGQIDDKRHRGRANYLFFDGHVEFLTRDVTLKKDEQQSPPMDMWGTDAGKHDEKPPASFNRDNLPAIINGNGGGGGGG